MIRKHTRDFFDVFFPGGKDPAVSGDYPIVPVDDDRIDESELTQG